MSFSLRLALFASLLVSATSIIIGVALTQTATEDLYHDLEARGMAVARGLADRASPDPIPRHLHGAGVGSSCRAARARG